MRIKCDYCGGFIDDTDEVCKHCGAANAKLKRVANGVPRTIEELKSWYKQQNLPPKEVTRFFIGEDYKYPKAFGIYKNEQTGNFIVYKNKADGSRAIRYSGKDEAYAVNEIYMKLKEEILKQKANNVNRRQSTPNNSPNRNYSPKRTSRSSRSSINVIVWVIVMFFFIIGIFLEITTPTRGYYNYNGNKFYYLDSHWYSYDYSTDSWGTTTVDDELHDNYSDYYESSSYKDSYDVSDFSDTSYYEDWYESNHSSDSNSSSSWDSGSSWDNDSSWDSGWDSSDSWGDSGGWDSDW